MFSWKQIEHKLGLRKILGWPNLSSEKLRDCSNFNSEASGLPTFALGRLVKIGFGGSEGLLKFWFGDASGRPAFALRDAFGNTKFTLGTADI